MWCTIGRFTRTVEENNMNVTLALAKESTLYLHRTTLLSNDVSKQKNANKIIWIYRSSKGEFFQHRNEKAAKDPRNDPPLKLGVIQKGIFARIVKRILTRIVERILASIGKRILASTTKRILAGICTPILARGLALCWALSLPGASFSISLPRGAQAWKQEMHQRYEREDPCKER